MLELDNVRVKIQAYTILRNVSFRVPAGQIVGLVGRNGAGKTTTLRTIMGLEQLQSGTIQMEGEDLSQISPYRRALRGIGYVPEDRRLVGTLSAEENILVPAWATGMRDVKTRLDYVYELIPEIKSLAQRRALQLSGGQQKMVALGRALITGTKLLLLDEPFEGLAPALSERFANVIRKLRDQGLAVLVAESDLKLISAMAETVYTIERGEILSDETENDTI
ncbi:MAG: ABC transporter ATP-binding protein [Chloroflexi bacterium]|nr:MAG: ABC transporter ATP-binding protein [Chloroflexota bacterium]